MSANKRSRGDISPREGQQTDKDSKKEEAAEAGTKPADPAKAPFGYEYLDHTADIQFHSWAPTLKTALEQQVVAMFGYMANLDTADIDPDATQDIEITDCHDLQSLTFKLLDEFLFMFSTEFILVKECEIVELDTVNFYIKAIGRGEKFSKKKHESGTEIKAITYSNMQVNVKEDRTDIYVIVDI